MATNIVDLTKTGVKNRADLPSNTTVLHVEHDDLATGLKYSGEFTVKRLSIGEISRVAVRKAQLNGGLSEEAIGRNMDYLHSMLAHLSIAVREAPDWWKPEDFFDASIIQDLYTEVMKYEDSFRKPLAARPQGTQNDSEKPAESKPAHDPKVVDKKVSSTAHSGGVSEVHA